MILRELLRIEVCWNGDVGGLTAPVGRVGTERQGGVRREGNGDFACWRAAWSAQDQASPMSTSARFMFIAMATNCRWQALRASPR